MEYNHPITYCPPMPAFGLEPDYVPVKPPGQFGFSSSKGINYPSESGISAAPSLSFYDNYDRPLLAPSDFARLRNFASLSLRRAMANQIAAGRRGK